MSGDTNADIGDIPRGKPKSGRTWKQPTKTRFSDNLRTKSQKSTWAEKMQRKKELQAIKEKERKWKDEEKAKKEALKLRREQNAKRRLENERRAEIVQPIKNTAKIKRMKKKTLRKIEKR